MFTYCLVTKGRREYLPSILESLDTALKDMDVQVIIVDNGCPADVSQILSGWCATGSDRKHYVRFDINDTSAPRVWSKLRDFDVHWLNFPGDDDLIHPEFLEDARNLVREKKNLTAIASSMRIIDSIGKPTGQVRQPVEHLNDHVKYLALSFHEPPFLFPGLFINFKKITSPLPNSRYIFDWWLSLNLISLGDVATTSKVSIDYRVHGDQESALAPNRRKYFEAQVILSRFIQGETFRNFISELSDDEKLRFWELLSGSGPIYGDREYGRALMFSISLLIADSMADSTNSSKLLGRLAALNGTFLRAGEANTLLPSIFSTELLSESNFQLIIAKGSCTQLALLVESTQVKVDQRLSFVVGCRHSPVKAEFLLDCDLIEDSPQLSLDVLIVQITERLEMEGLLEFKITPIERRILSLVRSLKRLIPSRLISTLRKGIN